MRRIPHARLLALPIAGLVWLFASLLSAQVPKAEDSHVQDLMQRRLYDDAARILLKEVEGKDEAQNAVRFVMLGEAYYLQQLYNEARPWYAKSLKYLPAGKNRIVAEYRLACLAYRMDDAGEAFQRTDEFLKAHPTDQRAGRLLLFKMKVLAKRGKAAMAEMEAAKRIIAANSRDYEAATDVAADKILTDYYLKIGEPDRAVSGYMAIVNNFRKVSQEYAADKRPIPQALTEAYDYAAMQLADIAIREKRHAEAVKWLDSIRFDETLKRQARLLLAEIAYNNRDYRKAEEYLLDGRFVETMPAGELRSSMYLLLGFCAKQAAQPTLEGVFKYFGKAEPGTKAYAQAQMGMADTAERWRRPDLAITSYENAASSPKYEPEALAKLGALYVQEGDKEDNQKKKDELYGKAADRLTMLTTKYPSSQQAKNASDTIRLLIGKGFSVKLAMSDEEVIREWEKTVQARPGTDEAARSLLNIARMQQKSIRDEKTDKFIKPPHYAACVQACERLLDEMVYTGKGFTERTWNDMKTEALYYRGMCHVGSSGQKTQPGEGGKGPVYVEKPDINRALRDLASARQLADPKQKDLIRNIEISTVEAMFKSDDEKLRREAEKKFDELLVKYGSDPRFQRLGLDLAEWHQNQGNLVEAARLYRGVADRGVTELSQDNITKLLFMSGKLYSMSAYEAEKTSTGRKYSLYVYPREVIRMAGLIETHKPLQKNVRVDWPADAGGIPAERALVLLSQASGIPFVWSRKRGADTIADYLATKKAQFDSPAGTVEQFLRKILDLENHELAFDLGLAGSAPTIAVQDAEGDDPELREERKAIEIYHRAQRLTRYEPVTRRYGAWQQAHKEKTMMFSVIRRVEQITETKVLWAEGVSSEDVLATEYAAIPGIPAGQDASCAAVLSALLEPMGLAFRVMPREVAQEYYELAKNNFNDIRRIAPKSPHAEKSLFLLALNFYHQEDYKKMKVVLQEYLKMFDTPTFEHYYPACFWIGWVLEREKDYRGACKYYNRAAEEVVVVYRPAEGEKMPSREELSARLSFDTRFALDEAVNATPTNFTLDAGFAEFVRLNSSVSIRLDGSAYDTNAIVRAPAKGVKVFDYVCDVLASTGLTFRAENAVKEVAEKAYYRMAFCYKRDDLNEQALASCRVLLDRYPKTPRRREAFKLTLDIYKALKDYRNVLAALGAMQKEMAGELEAYKVDYELGGVYHDLCRYDDAVEHFRKALQASRSPSEQLAIREGYARAVLRKGDLQEALGQYASLKKQETDPLRAGVDELVHWYLERALDKTKADELPLMAAKALREYDGLDEKQRADLSRNAMTLVTWIYYTTGLVDLLRGDKDRALSKFDAAGNSPDDALAAEALYQAAMVHEGEGRLDAAKESLQYMLFSTRSAEAEVKGAYALGNIHKKRGETDQATAQFDGLIKKFPDSFYARKVEEEREKERQEKERAEKEKAAREQAEKAAGAAVTNAVAGGTPAGTAGAATNERPGVVRP